MSDNSLDLDDVFLVDLGLEDEEPPLIDLDEEDPKPSEDVFDTLISLDDEEDESAIGLIELEEEEPESEGIREDLTYPCLVIEGVLVVQEIEYLRSKEVDPEYAVPLYLNFQGSYSLQGEADISMDGLLSLKSLGYSLTLYTPDGSPVPLEGPEDLIKFMKV